MLLTCPPLPTFAHAVLYMKVCLEPKWTVFNYGVPCLHFVADNCMVLVKRHNLHEVWGEGRTWHQACMQALNASRPIKGIAPDGTTTFFL